MMRLQPFLKDVALVVGDGEKRLYQQEVGDMTLQKELWVASASKMVFVTRKR